MTTRCFTLWLYRTTLFTLLALLPQPNASAQARNDVPEFVPDEVIIQFRLNATGPQLSDALQRGVLNVKEHLPARGRRAGESGLVLMRTRLPVARAVAALEKHPAIEYAEPNFIYQHNAAPNDPQYLSGKLWGMYGDATSPANQFGSQAGEAWLYDNLGSSDIYIGVIDEGIDISHPDLAPNIGTNPGEIPGNGIDDDGNGYVDDVNGWDFFHNDNGVFDAGDADRCQDDHGTHVSGTIGARGGNGVGVAGMCWNVKILSGKFLGPQGGGSAYAAKAIRYFIDLKQRHRLNIVALNNSWGGSAYSRVLHEAIIEAANAGILFVCAAGNSSSDSDLAFNHHYPADYDSSAPVPWISLATQPTAYATYDSLISVAAIDSNGKLARFSSWGLTTVDLGAPGVNVMSTIPRGRYASWDGTSMATPHVTGACALYFNTHRAATPEQIKAAILDAARATPTSSINGKTVTGGRLNVSGF